MCWKTGLTVGGIKLATWLFNSILCNSAKQVAHFCCSFSHSFKGTKRTLHTDDWRARYMSVCCPRAPRRLARRYLKIYVTEINKNRLNTCVVACAYHVYHSVAKRLSSNPVPGLFRQKKAGAKRSRSCFPARVGCLAWKLERFYSLLGVLHQGAPEPRKAFLPSLVSAWETFHVRAAGVERLTWTWACRQETKYPATSMKIKMRLTVIDFCSVSRAKHMPVGSHNHGGQSG